VLAADRVAAAVRHRGRPALELYVWSRLGIWAAALFAWLVFEPNRHPDASRWDSARLHELGIVTDIWARWDSDWFLRIAEHGYSTPSSTPAFYPLYPALTGGLGRVLLGHYLLAGLLISLAAGAVAFVLLHHLARERLGEAGAVRAVLYLAVFPMSFFLQAVYSESLYLALALGAFLLAERGRFLGAGAVTGLALLTRAAGFALLPALAIVAWRSADRRGALLRLGVAPLLFLAYPLALWLQIGKPLELFHAQEVVWQRHVSWLGPLGGLWDGVRAGWAGVRQLASGSHTHAYWSAVTDTDPLRVAALNLEQLGFALLALGLGVYAWRRFGAPYGIFSLVSLAIPLSVPAERWPLLSMPRFTLAIFPLFLALAALGARPRLHAAIVSLSAILLGVSVAQWALWQWVA
jgi:Mannosyltransferase (PIG-V)